MCDIWISVDVICCTSSILHLVAISVDRYWAVTRVDYIRNRSHRRTIAMVGIIWVISVSISIPPLFGWKDQDIQPGDCIISQDWGYTVYSTFGAFYLPLAVIIIFYAKIFQASELVYEQLADVVVTRKIRRQEYDRFVVAYINKTWPRHVIPGGIL